MHVQVLGSDVIDSVFLRKKEPWDLSRQELICQWEQLDRDGNGSLSLAELTHLAASYFQKQTEQIQREMNLRREQGTCDQGWGCARWAGGG